MIREQDRMDALAVLAAMSDILYAPLGEIASRAKLTPARAQRVLHFWPSLIEKHLADRAYFSKGLRKTAKVYEYRRKPNAIEKVRAA